MSSMSIGLGQPLRIIRHAKIGGGGTPRFYNSVSISSLNMSLTQTQIQTVSTDEQILSCIDKGLESVGLHVKNAVYWHLQRIGRVRRFEIPEKPMVFVQGLRSLYRASSAGVENAILQEISTMFHIHCGQGTDLVAAIFQARSKGTT